VLNDEDVAITFWSPVTGDTEVVELGERESLMLAEHAPVFARDTPIVVFATLEEEGSLARLHVWDVEGARAHELTRVPRAELHYAVDSDSGAVVFIDENHALELWSPRDAETSRLLDEAVALFTSASGKTIIAEGKRESEHGNFLIRYDGAAPHLLEAGNVLAVGDTTLFFQAADGVCTHELVTAPSVDPAP